MAETLARFEEPAGEPAVRTCNFEFRGRAGEYFRIWIVNVCLTIVTLGVYSAWAKVRSQQYFAASTHLDGAPFAYLARPIAILKGRLLVLGFAVLYGLASFLSSWVEVAFAFASMLLIPWAIARSLAFRAYHTAWRNIRFGFRARYGPAFGAYLGYPMLGAVTLGALYPDAVYRQRRHLLENARFGATPFEMASRRRDFYRLFGLLALLLVAAAGAIGVTVWKAPQGGLVAGLVGLPLYFLFFGMAASGLTNLTYDGARLGPHRLASRLPGVGLSGVYASNALAVLLSLGLLLPWARIRLARYRLQHLSLEVSGSLEDFVASQEQEVGAVASELGDSLGLDIGL